jgi:hypothetical protein
MSNIPSRPGRPEAAIPPDAPAKELAEYLRNLRRAVGAPSYRRLGLLVYTAHNALSQTADGRLVGWPSVVRYLQALSRYAQGAGRPDVVTEMAVADIRKLHEQCSAYRSRRPSKTVPARRSRTAAELLAAHLLRYRLRRRRLVKVLDPTAFRGMSLGVSRSRGRPPSR